jgi:polyisoprenoid-binding protein YceI
MKSIELKGRMLAAIALLLCAAAPAAGQEVPLEPGSSVHVAGNSTLHRWSCVTASLDARVLRDAAEPTTLADSATAVGELVVPIATLECGDDGMERQMRAALKATDHPHIRYTLERFDMQRSNTTFVVETTGTIAVAGVQRPIALVVRGEMSSNGVIRATGSAPIRMTDFGIEPPTAFFGLLKASDEITVSFDLRVRQGPGRVVAGN